IPATCPVSPSGVRSTRTGVDARGPAKGLVGFRVASATKKNGYRGRGISGHPAFASRTRIGRTPSSSLLPPEKESDARSRRRSSLSKCEQESFLRHLARRTSREDPQVR